MIEMYKGIANSPETTITNDINNLDTIIYVLDETRIPELPNIMVLGNGISAETVKVLSIAGNALTVQRGFQGVAKSWNAGTIIARNFTEYDYDALVENVKELDEEKTTEAVTDNKINNHNTDEFAHPNLQQELADVIQQSNENAIQVQTHKTETVSELVSIERDVSLSGSQVVSGFSRKPKTIIIYSAVPNTKKISFGQLSGNGQRVLYQEASNQELLSANNTSICIADSAINETRGNITVNPDNTITINWTKSGSGGTGTARINITAFYHGGD